ncbi:MAG: sigma-54-dependent Fis family transcriptional regulator [Sandaracinus sp.]
MTAGDDTLSGNLALSAQVARDVGAIGPDGTSLRAQVLLFLGRFDEARALLEDALAEVELAGEASRGGEALALLALVDAREGILDRAIQRWDAAVQRLRSARTDTATARWAVRALSDAAEALLDRDGPADISAAAARLATARALLATGGLVGASPTTSIVLAEPASPDDRPLLLRLRLLLDRARGATSDLEGAVHAIELAIPQLSGRGLSEIAWRAHAALGRLHAHRGAEVQAARANERAMEILEDQATALPRELRESFWADPERARVRKGVRGAPRSVRETSSEPGRDARWARMLEITKRLASERDLDKLLERITDSAVDLSGAERGFVLLVEADGSLGARTVRDAARPDDPHVAFSRSIAEAVLIDGEPIITVDARADGRLNEYLSVHKLMLQSVACLPIRDASGIQGVLYVEHRVRKGRFGPGDVELLLALADQAAIALANARTVAELEAERQRLAETNEALEKAKEEIERLLDARTVELDDTRRELVRARDTLRASFEKQGIVGRSDAIRRVLAIVERVRDTTVPVVIHGESGTGKELVARAIHFGGTRSKKPFVALNCAAVPENLLESELFGHKKGSFTGADRDRPGVFVQASGGTLFLDEIGDMPAKMQVELLRVLQDQKVRAIGSDEEIAVDVRIVSASNKLLSELVAKGAFREDLFYRLNVVELRLPALRDRREDIPLLCEHFLAAIAKREGTSPKRISRDALRRLSAHPLPGNVRQLEHILVNACVMTDADLVEARDLTLLGPWEEDASAPPEPALVDELDDDEDEPATEGTLPENEEAWKAQEKRKILEALEAASWNRVRAAKNLGMPRRTFYRRLKEYGILE